MSRLPLILLCAVLGFVLAGPTDPEPRPDQWWIDRHNSYIENTNTNGRNINVLFYGDSITEGWGGAGSAIFQQYYAPFGTANYGIGGDQTQHLLYRISNGEVDNINLRPKLCVLKIGTNNFGYPDQEIADGVIAVVNLLRSKIPTMKILLLGILPRNNAELTAKADNVNSMFNHLDDGNMVRYFSLRDVFYRGNGEFYNELYTEDLLHLSTAGYQAWAEAMNQIFLEMYNS